jgi:hypothetical protein
VQFLAKMPWCLDCCNAIQNVRMDTLLLSCIDVVRLSLLSIYVSCLCRLSKRFVFLLDVLRPCRSVSRSFIVSWNSKCRHSTRSKPARKCSNYLNDDSKCNPFSNRG